jgi:hypothetical protein
MDGCRYPSTLCPVGTRILVLNMRGALRDINLRTCSTSCNTTSLFSCEKKREGRTPKKRGGTRRSEPPQALPASMLRLSYSGDGERWNSSRTVTMTSQNTIAGPSCFFGGLSERDAAANTSSLRITIS